MKRYAVLLTVLVTIDQLLGWAANTAFANGQEIGWAFLRIGRWDHFVPIAHFAPLLIATIAALFAMAAMFRLGLRDNFYQLFGTPIALIASALVTQVIDMSARGYAVNYVGLSGAGWVVKVTDVAYEGAMVYTGLLVLAGFIISGYRGMKHGKTNRPVLGRLNGRD